MYVLKNPAADMFQAQFIFATCQAFFLLQKEQLSVFSGGSGQGSEGGPGLEAGPGLCEHWGTLFPGPHVFRWQVS